MFRVVVHVVIIVVVVVLKFNVPLCVISETILQGNHPTSVKAD